MDFKAWILNEKADIFGFDRDDRKNAPKIPDDKPIDTLKSEILLGELSKLNLGMKSPCWEWSDQIRWGDDRPGAVKLTVSPAGSLKVFMRKKMIDLEGNDVWACKRIVALNNINPDKGESYLAQCLFDELQKVDGELLEMPTHEFPFLERLVVSLATKVRQDAPPFFIYEGIRKVSNFDYLIWFSARGHGAGKRDARRIEQFNINVSFSPRTGMIRCFGNEISSPMNDHLWQPRPSEWDEYFTPTQPRGEIEQAIVNALSSY